MGLMYNNLYSPRIDFVNKPYLPIIDLIHVIIDAIFSQANEHTELNSSTLCHDQSPMGLDMNWYSLEYLVFCRIKI